MLMRIESWFWWGLVALVVFVVVARVSASPVGCELYNSSVIKCWNQGSIENETYISRDLVQSANGPDRFGWAEYSYRLATVRDGGQVFRDLDCGSRPFYDSDNVSYWRLWCNDSLSAGPYSLVYNVSFSQGVFDDYVHRDSSFKTVAGFDSFTGEVYLYTLHDLIDIDLDSDVDAVNFRDGGLDYGFFLNESGRWGNVTGGRLLLGDMDSDSGIMWKWDRDIIHGVVVQDSPGQVNNRVYLYKMWNITSPIGNGVERTVRHDWIDADVCTYSKPPGCEIQSRNFDTTTGNYVSVDGTVTGSFRWRWWCPNFLGCPPVPAFGTCNPNMVFSGGCYIVAYDNITFGGDPYQWSNDTSQDNPFLQVGNASTLQSHMDQMNINYKGQTQNFTIFCGENSPYNISFIGCLDISADACERNLTAEDDQKEFIIQCREEWELPEIVLVLVGLRPVRLFGMLFYPGWW